MPRFTLVALVLVAAFTVHIAEAKSFRVPKTFFKPNKDTGFSNPTGGQQMPTGGQTREDKWSAAEEVAFVPLRVTRN